MSTALISECVYVARFSDGIVKVGRTSRIKPRMAKHMSQARKRGAYLTEHWSTPHHAAWAAEAQLRRLGRELGEVAWGTEYFCNVDYQQIISEAKAIFGISEQHEHRSSPAS